MLISHLKHTHEKHLLTQNHIHTQPTEREKISDVDTYNQPQCPNLGRESAVQRKNGDQHTHLMGLGLGLALWAESARERLWGGVG